MFQLINCTPHPVRVATGVFRDKPVTAPAAYALGADGRHRLELFAPAGLYEVLPSGWRLAAEATTSGLLIGCSVVYGPTDEGRAEAAEIRRRVADSRSDVTTIVIASEISVRAYLQDFRRVHATEDGGPVDVRLVWPVFAQDALRLPPDQRWADKLATVHEPISNGVEVVGTAPYWEHAA